MSTVDCSIIIVNWNVKDLVIKTISHVLEQTNVNTEIIVVDNASSDGSVQAIQQAFPEQVKLIASPVNLGFAKANNLGAQQASGDYLLILNPDCYLNEGSLNLALQSIKNNQVDILGFRLFNADGSQQLSVRNFPRLKDIFLFCLRINHWQKIFSIFSNYFQLNFDYNKSQPVEQVMGACFLIKTELFKQLKGFDEKFFIWFEEVDLCKRVKDLNKTIYYDKDCTAVHVGGQSFHQASGCYKSKIFYNSLYYYTTKHFSLVFKPIFFIICKLAILPGCFYSLWKKKA